MAALPKQKTSKGAKGKRRSHHRAEVRRLSECSHCHNARLPHTVCPTCGYYKGREVVIVAEPELPE